MTTALADGVYVLTVRAGEATLVPLSAPPPVRPPASMTFPFPLA